VRGRRAGKEQRSATPRSLTRWVGGESKPSRAGILHKPNYAARERGLWPKAIAHNCGAYVTCPTTRPLPNGQTTLTCPATTALAACEPQALGGVYREARSGEAAAGTERDQLCNDGKPMAVLCLRRFVRRARTSEGAALAVLYCKRRD